MRKNLTKILGVLLSLLLLVSCSSTRLLSSWAGDIPSNTMNKVLVFSLLQKKDNTYQDNFEDAIVKDLNYHGAQAYSAFDIFGPDALKKKNKEDIAKTIRDAGFTGVMLITLLDKEQSEEYVPPTTTTYAVPVGPVFHDPWFNPYFNCYSYYYDQVSTPGYWTTTTNYILEVRLYNAQDENDAIYIAKTSTRDPSDAQTMALEFGKIIADDMKAKGLLQK